MIWVKILGPGLVYIIALTRDAWKDKSKSHVQSKRILLGLMSLAMILSVAGILYDDSKTKEAEKTQVEHQTQLQIQNDSLTSRIDSLINLTNRGEARSERQNVVLQDRLIQLNSKLEPFIKIAVAKYPELTIEEALSSLVKDMSEQKKKLSVLFEYSQVAKLNFIGLTGGVKYPLVESTGISQLLEGSYTLKGDTIIFKYDETSISKFKSVISQYPRFPFAYWEMAIYLNKLGDPKWRTYAQEALTILRKTTMIDGHHQNHDLALKEIEQALASSR